MIYKPMLALIFAVPAVSVAVGAFINYVRKLCRLLFAAVQQVYASHKENVQMRLAPPFWGMDECRQRRANDQRVI
jgi:hypothetical protein